MLWHRVLFIASVVLLMTTLPVLAAQTPRDGNGPAGAGGADAPDRFSAGVLLGRPSGISLKYWLAPAAAVDAAVGWDFRDERLHIHANYLQHFFDLFATDPDRLPVYVGIGADLRIRVSDNDDSDDLRGGLRVPLGVSFLSADVPVDVFAELVPGMRIYPETKFDFWWGIGARYRFGARR